MAPGGPLQAQVTFGNSGTDPVPSFSYRVYLSTDAAISGGDVTVGEYAAGGVPAGSTAVENLSATVPTGASAGTDYYLIILADPADLVPETDEGNNTGYDSTVFHVVELPKRRAVAVGISDYLWIGDLAYCDADAIDFGSTLSAADEWAVSDVNVLVNQFAYKADIEAAIASAGAELSAGDTFVFFFSGHGGSDTDLAPFDELDGWDEYICTYDSDLFVWDYDIRDDELEQWLQNYIPAGVETCVIIDSCNSGGMAKGKWGGSSLAEGLADDFRRRAKGGVQAKDIDALSPLVGLFASTETEDSWEDSFLMHGVFTYFVLAALNSPSTDADTNGWYSGEEVFDVAGPATTVYEPSQHPVLVDNCPGELDFRTAE